MTCQPDLRSSSFLSFSISHLFLLHFVPLILILKGKPDKTRAWETRGETGKVSFASLKFDFSPTNISMIDLLFCLSFSSFSFTSGTGKTEITSKTNQEVSSATETWRKMGRKMNSEMSAARKSGDSASSSALASSPRKTQTIPSENMPDSVESDSKSEMSLFQLKVLAKKSSISTVATSSTILFCRWLNSTFEFAPSDPCGISFRQRRKEKGKKSDRDSREDDRIALLVGITWHMEKEDQKSTDEIPTCCDRPFIIDHIPRHHPQLYPFVASVTSFPSDRLTDSAALRCISSLISHIASFPLYKSNQAIQSLHSLYPISSTSHALLPTPISPRLSQIENFVDLSSALKKKKDDLSRGKSSPSVKDRSQPSSISIETDLHFLNDCLESHSYIVPSGSGAELKNCNAELKSGGDDTHGSLTGLTIADFSLFCSLLALFCSDSSLSQCGKAKGDDCDLDSVEQNDQLMILIKKILRLASSTGRSNDLTHTNKAITSFPLLESFPHIQKYMTMMSSTFISSVASPMSPVSLASKDGSGGNGGTFPSACPVKKIQTEKKCEKTQDTSSPTSSGTNFIKQIIEDDIRNGKFDSSTIITRFPPEPNGFLHLGHAKSICLNFGLANTFNGRCNLRLDDTNPQKEETRYIESIKADVKWLGGDWGDRLYHASDYFDQLFEWAVLLIERSLAYVDDQTIDQIRANRGSLTEAGKNSPYRERSIEENKDLFLRMKSGEFEEGSRVLRAKIDMAHGNMNMRDPVLYRILKKSHPRTGDKWCIYPMYDFTHGQSDSLEKISHSICTLEFELHRPLYEWFQEKLDIHRTRQIEFARLNVTYTMMSKRRLLALVEEKIVLGWDDPRMPTLSGLRRRGIPAAAIRDFCDRVGVAKRENVINIELLELCAREYLHKTAQRRFSICSPLLVKIKNISDDDFFEDLDIPNHPENASMGTRKLSFGKEIYIDESDFMEVPCADFYRLSVGREVRLRYGYWIKCEKVVKNDKTGKIEYLECTYDPLTRGGESPPDGRKVKATLHWLSKKDSRPAQLRIYKKLFTVPDPDEAIAAAKASTQANGAATELSWRNFVNPESLQTYKNALVESSCLNAMPGEGLQFERIGFFTRDKKICFDPEDENGVKQKEQDHEEVRENDLIFNMAVGLLDTYAALQSDSDEKKKKEDDKLAREKAAEERRAKKEERERREAEKKAKLLATREASSSK